MYFDTEKLKNTKLTNTPFCWAVTRSLLDPEFEAKLASQFPEADFMRMRREAGSDKSYEAWFRAIKQPTSDIFYDGLSDSWRLFVDAVGSQTYRSAIGDVIGVDLSDHLLEITLWRYGAGHFLGPHTDIASKSVAHLFYFNTTWNVDWGGCLRILGSRNEADIYSVIPPTLGKSVLLVRSEESWHDVSRLYGSASDERKVVQVSFWRENPRQGPDLPGLETLEIRRQQ